MNRNGFWMRACTFIVGISLLMSFMGTPFVAAQTTEGPTMLHPRLDVRPVISGLTTPITMAFLDENEFLVLEKNTGMVQYVVDGSIHHTALDLAVNFFSERGLLGIALDPDFESNHFVYLYWSCIAPPPPPDNPFFPTQDECAETPELGPDTPDSEDVLAVPLLGNRVDRFTWDGESLTFDLNLIMLRSFQHDAAPEPPDQGDEEQPPRGNHDGGVLTFGADGKLYIMVGDVGRRGQLQNLPSGPTETGLGPTVPDDQFGGPEPDDAHFTGVILRLNPDGTTPEDNPFFDAGAEMGGEVGENIQKIFAYGIRNSFGMAVDPLSGNLWQQENGEDAFDELNLVEPGMNSGWIQIMGPASRIEEYKQIETTSLHFEDFPNLQQFRWGPERIADTPEEARSRLFVLPGSEFSDPEFSWKHVLPPAAIGFLDSQALGSEFRGDLFVGFSVPEPLGGPLFVFDLTGNRQRIRVSDPRLQDRVADNVTFREMTESESLLIGQNFGVITDIKTGPNGNLFVVSLSQGAVYEIFRIEGAGGNVRSFSTELSGAAEEPGPGDPDGSGTARIILDRSQGKVCFVLTVSNIELPATGAHIHEAPVGAAGPVVVPLTPPDESGSSSGCVTDVDQALIRNIIQNPENYYVNVHNAEFPDGAVRGQLTRAGNGDDDDDDGEDDDDDNNGARRLSTELSGAAEVPGPGDPDGTGTANIRLRPNQGEVCFEITVSNIALPATGAHIHAGTATEAGSVVVALTPPDESGTSSGCVSDVDPALIRNIIQNPEQYYVNVHNEGFPDGAVRGQLHRPNGDDDDDGEDEDDGEDDDDNNGNVRRFATELSGVAEVPGPGDPDGSGTASLRLNPGKGEVCFELTVSNIALPATGAHIHVGPVTEAGDVVVPLEPAPDASGSSSGCVSADRALIRAIIQNPEEYYVNVHNEEFPGGAVRGQLSK